MSTTDDICDNAGDEMSSYLENTFSFVDRSEMKKFAGSSCPGMNSSMKIDANLIKSNDVYGVVSLNEAELDFKALEDEGIAHLRLAVKDYRPPTLNEMIDITKFVIAVQDGRDDRGVLVHCNAGMGRTGTVLACLLCWEDDELSASDSVKHLRKVRKGSVQTYKQEDFVQEWVEYLKKCSYEIK